MEQDFAQVRRLMVEHQIRARGISNERVLAAMREVPRHLFVPGDLGSAAYGDHPLPIGEGQTISQPYIVAVMTDLLAPGPADRVLEIGAGSGYQAAVLGRIVREVWSVERIPAVAVQAEKNLDAAGATNVRVVVGDGTLGLPDHAPYDGIIVTAAAPSVPQPLFDQLADGGRLVAPIGSRNLQDLVCYVRRGADFARRIRGGVTFVPLIGAYGWEE
ncbi:MAG: protein-L-isoaspartate(D-aspartate) O-methyltransferase [Methanofollis sp.]|nr:protein-L-isoaspartate(D-aspartate) O-methyltransferase [Methanofollis sp.]